MRIVIELKQTIFMNDLKKSALLLIVLGSLLLLKSTFYKVVSNGADGSFLFLIWQHFLVPFFYEPRASVINSNTKQTKHRLHSAGSVVIASNNIIAITR